MKPTILILTVLAAAGGLISAQEAQGNPKQAFEQLMEKARDAKSAGRFDEARELAEKAEKLRHEMHELRLKNAHEGEKHAKHPPMKSAGPGPERFEHVMQAVQHLHAAGMHDVAENLQRIAESMRHAMQEHLKHEHVAAQKKPMLEAKPAPQKKPAPDKKPGEQVKKPAAPNPELEELRQQMRRMQEQIEKLGGELKKQQAGA